MELLISIFVLLVLMVFVITWLLLYAALKRALSTVEELTTAISSLEEENGVVLTANDKYDVWFEEFKMRVVSAYQRIKSIDASGHFEADDEVGYFFKELKSIIERLHELGIMDEIEKQETEVIAPKITTEELQRVLAQRRSAVVSSVPREEK